MKIMSSDDCIIGMSIEELLDQVSDVVFEVDQEWRITYVNERMVKDVDQTKKELLGEKIWEVFPEVQKKSYETKCRQLMETHDSITFEAYCTLFGRWLMVQACPSETGVVVYCHDISEKKELESALERYDTILTSIENGVFLANEKFEFIDVNRAYIELSGYSREELVGSHVSKVISDSNLTTAVELGKKVRAGEESVGVIETGLETADGDTLPIASKFVPFIASDGSIQTVGVVRDISEQKSYERTLTSLHDVSRKLVEAESREEVCDLLVKAATEILDFSGVVVYLHDDEDETLVPVSHSDDADRYYGSLLTLQSTPDSSITANVFASGETTNFDDVTDSQLLFNESVDIRSGLFIPLKDHGIIVIGDGEAGVFDEKATELTDTLAATAESALSRLDREERIQARERMVTTLYDATRELMQAETKESISQVAVTAATELLGLSSAGIFLWNEQKGTLESTALSPDVQERLDEPLVFESNNSLAWEAFVEGETKLYNDLHDEDRRYNRETRYRSQMIIPIGTQGVFLSGSTSVSAYDETDLESAELLSANVGAALDRAEREQNVREQERQLQAQNRELARLNQINSVIRNVVKSLVQTTSSAQLKNQVCRHLVGAEPYRFAWFATRDPKTGEIQRQAWSEENSAYLETGLLSPTSDTERDRPLDRAFEFEETQVVENILNSEEPETWRKESLKRGYQSAISIPVRYGDLMYGVLEVYGGKPSMFTGEEYDILLELSNTLGNALNSIEQTEALLSGSDTELEFRITETSDPLFHLARELDCEIELEALIPSSDDSWLLYVLVDGSDPKQVVGSIEQHVAVRQVSHIRTESERELFGVNVSEPTSFVIVAEHGAALKSLTIDGGEGRIVLSIPRTIDVRKFVDMCLKTFPNSEFVRRGQVQAPEQSQDIVNMIALQLTDRQREAIELAYRSGYFAWPRDRTGDEIAEMMGITPPTFHSHLRKGLNSLLGAIIDANE